MDPEGQERGTAQKGWVEGSRQQESGDHPQGRGGEFRFPPRPLLSLVGGHPFPMGRLSSAFFVRRNNMTSHR